MVIPENPDIALPDFKYQDQLQEIMFMVRKQVYLVGKLLDHATSTQQLSEPLMA